MEVVLEMQYFIFCSIGKINFSTIIGIEPEVQGIDVDHRLGGTSSSLRPQAEGCDGAAQSVSHINARTEGSVPIIVREGGHITLADVTDRGLGPKNHYF